MQGLFPFIGVEESQARGLGPVGLPGAGPSSEPSFRGVLLGALGRPAGLLEFPGVSARAGPSSLALQVAEVLGERRPLGAVLPPFAEAALSRLGGRVTGFPTEAEDVSDAGRDPMDGAALWAASVAGGETPGWPVRPAVVLEGVAARDGDNPLVLMLRPEEGSPPAPALAEGHSGALNAADGSAARVVLRASFAGGDSSQVAIPTRELFATAFRLVAPDDIPSPGMPDGQMSLRPLPFPVDGSVVLGEETVAFTLIGSSSEPRSSVQVAPGAASGLPPPFDAAGGKPSQVQVTVELPVRFSPEGTTSGEQQAFRAALPGVNEWQPLLERLGADEVKLVSLSELKQEAPAEGRALPLKALFVPESEAVLLRFQSGLPEAAEPVLLFRDTVPVDSPVAAGRMPAEGQPWTASAQAQASVEVDLLAPSLSNQLLRVWVAPSAGAVEAPQDLSALALHAPTAGQLPQVTKVLESLWSAPRADWTPPESGAVQPILVRAEPAVTGSLASNGSTGQGSSVDVEPLEPAEFRWLSSRPPEAATGRQRVGVAALMGSEKSFEPVQPMAKPASLPAPAALPSGESPLKAPGGFGGQLGNAPSTETVVRPPILAVGEPEGTSAEAGWSGLPKASPRPASVVADPAHAGAVIDHTGGTAGRATAPMTKPAGVLGSSETQALQPEGFRAAAALDSEGYGWNAEGWPANAASQAPGVRAVLQPVRREEVVRAEPTAGVSKVFHASSAHVGQSPTAGPKGFRLEAAPAVRDWQPLFEQITRHVRTALPEGRGEMQLRLEPPQLGRLRLQVAVEEGRVTARFVTETKEAQAMLRGHLSELHAALSESGLRVQEVKLTLAGHGDPWAADSGSFGRERQGLSHESWRQAETADGNPSSYGEDRPSSSEHRQPSLRGWEALLKADGRRIDYRV